MTKWRTVTAYQFGKLRAWLKLHLFKAYPPGAPRHFV
jgi:hypothetical protein